MIKEEKYEQYGFPRREQDILGITIHETGNDNMTAKELFDYLENENKTSQGCHYIVDNNEVIEVMPNDWGVYHTGKAMDYGNRYTISIEVCSNINNDKFNNGVDKAVELIKELMIEYAIPKDSIFFHIDFNQNSYCPKTLIRQYGSVKRFVIEKVED